MLPPLQGFFSLFVKFHIIAAFAVAHVTYNIVYYGPCIMDHACLNSQVHFVCVLPPLHWFFSLFITFHIMAMFAVAHVMYSIVYYGPYKSDFLSGFLGCHLCIGSFLFS